MILKVLFFCLFDQVELEVEGTTSKKDSGFLLVCAELTSRNPQGIINSGMNQHQLNAKQVPLTTVLSFSGPSLMSFKHERIRADL